MSQAFEFMQDTAATSASASHSVATPRPHYYGSCYVSNSTTLVHYSSAFDVVAQEQFPYLIVDNHPNTVPYLLSNVPRFCCGSCRNGNKSITAESMPKRFGEDIQHAHKCHNKDVSHMQQQQFRRSSRIARRNMTYKIDHCNLYTIDTPAFTP